MNKGYLDKDGARQASAEDLPFDPATPLFRVRSFSLLFVTRVASTTAFQMLSVLVGWHVYELTDSALHLGLIGLAQFMAPVLLMVPAGQIVDRSNRRFVLRCCYAVAHLGSFRGGRHGGVDRRGRIGRARRLRGDRDRGIMGLAVPSTAPGRSSRRGAALRSLGMTRRE